MLLLWWRSLAHYEGSLLSVVIARKELFNRLGMQYTSSIILLLDMILISLSSGSSFYTRQHACSVALVPRPRSLI